MKSKSILKSRAAWVGVLSAVVEYSGLLSVVGVPPGTLTYVTAGAMIGLRVITKGPVHVLRDAATEP